MIGSKEILSPVWKTSFALLILLSLSSQLSSDMALREIPSDLDCDRTIFVTLSISYFDFVNESYRLYLL